MYLTPGEEKALRSGRGSPQIYIHEESYINMELGPEPLPNGFVSVPVITFANGSLEDDLGYDGCNLAYETTQQRRYSNVNYQDFWWVRNFVQGPLSQALGIPESILEDLRFDQVYDYTDVYFARTFEGLPVADSSVWDDNTYLEMLTMQKIELTDMFSHEARRLVFSRVMRKPLELMEQRVDEIMGRVKETSEVRYMIYSAHDEQISNMVEYMHPTNIEQDYIKYAAQVVFELHFTCTDSEDCFTV